MMPKPFCLLISVVVFSVAAFARGGGSVVGNGAGLVENNFQYAYSTLMTLVSNCLEVRDCGVTEVESKIMISMRKVLSENSQRTDRLIFISEKDHPGFFETGPGERHRIAKTGLSSESPIYINIDALYGENGKPLLDFPVMVSILAHEVGHQAGEKSHALLDILGSKIRDSLEQKMMRHEMPLRGNPQPVEVLIINHSLPMKSAQILLSWPDSGSRAVTGDLLEHLKCTEGEAFMAGFEFRNGHFILFEGSSPEGLNIGFGVWVYLSCYSQSRGAMGIEKIQMRFRIDQSLKFQFVDKNRIP